MAGTAVVVGAATSVVTNLVVDGWPVVLVVVLVVLVVLGVVLAVVPLWSRRAVAASGRGTPVWGQRVRASGDARVVQVGGDLVLPSRGSPADGVESGGAER